MFAARRDSRIRGDFHKVVPTWAVWGMFTPRRDVSSPEGLQFTNAHSP